MGWAGTAKRACWVLLGAFLVFYGTGDKDLISVVLFDTRLYDDYILFGEGALLINAASFSYVYFYLHYVKGDMYPLVTAPWAVQLGGATLAASVVSFTVGLWPIYGLLTPVVVLVITFGAIFGFSFIPAIGPMAMQKRATAGLGKIDEDEPHTPAVGPMASNKRAGKTD